ncbi:MAG: hypothetical protein HP496_17530, partial [Nitrospira sp.]|nr:hypothetical protein [Nitrospira sp.]
MKERLIVMLQHPFAPLLPWASVALCLLAVLFFVHGVGLAEVQLTRERLEKEWVAMRQSLVQHKEARK